MMLFRPQRGTLAESMAGVQEFDGTAAGLKALMLPAKPKVITVKPYGGVDPRNGWNTHIVTVKGYGVVGFTDGPLL